MNRTEFHKLFKTPGPVVLPVIHVLDVTQTSHNIRTAVIEGAHGVLLINHDFPVDDFLPILREVRAAFPLVWLGVNFLAVTGKEAFPPCSGNWRGRALASTPTGSTMLVLMKEKRSRPRAKRSQLGDPVRRVNGKGFI